MKRKLSSLFLTLLALVCFTSAACSAAAESPSGVTYEIFVASFQDSNGDGIGDLQGVINQLDYIESLGVSRIWLMPIHPSPSYHKYDVTDYRAIAPEYGTLDDFDALVAACKARSISVTLDLVVNHTSKAHPWFQEACAALRNGTASPYVDWYHFTQESGANLHAVPGTAAWWYEGQFGDHMPDLNLDNPAVRAEIADIIHFWQDHGVTGFRLDAVTSYYTGAARSTVDFLHFITETAKATDPNCYLVGEAWTDEVAILNLYESGIDSLFNFPAADVNGRLIKSALNESGAAAATALADWNRRIREVNPAALDAPFLTNHDLARARGALRSDVNKQKAAAALYLLLPGRPTVYYGEELGMSGSGRDENKRLPMLWSAEDPTLLCRPPAEADQNQRLKEGVDAQSSDPDSLLSWYREVIALRRQAPELDCGVMTALDAGHQAVAYYRVDSRESAVAVLINTSSKETVSVDVSSLGDLTVQGACGQAEISGTTVVLSPISCILVRTINH